MADFQYPPITACIYRDKSSIYGPATTEDQIQKMTTFPADPREDLIAGHDSLSYSDEDTNHIYFYIANNGLEYKSIILSQNFNLLHNKT